MSEFAITLEPFKKMTAKLIDRIRDRSISDEAIHEAKYIWAIHWLNFVGTELDRNQALSLFLIGMREYRERMVFDG